MLLSSTVVPTGLSEIAPYSSPLLWYSQVSPTNTIPLLCCGIHRSPMPLHCVTLHTHKFVQHVHNLAPHCSLIQSAVALVEQSRMSDDLAC